VASDEGVESVNEVPVVEEKGMRTCRDIMEIFFLFATEIKPKNRLIYG
jgi:hypothetical protein